MCPGASPRPGDVNMLLPRCSPRIMGGASLTRPELPDTGGLLAGFLFGEGFGMLVRGPLGSKTDQDIRLMERLRDFVSRGRHTEASSKQQSFDFPLWREFLRQTLELKKKGGLLV